MMAKRDGEGLIVNKIRNGVVIDHIEPGMSLNVLKMLDIDGSQSNPSIISVLMNAPSSRMGHKDIVKAEGRELKTEEIDIIALISPRATINSIHQYKVIKKYSVVIPKEIKGSLLCANPSCITNQNEPVASEFDVVSSKPLRIRCRYCGRDMNYGDVCAYINKNRP